MNLVLRKTRLLLHIGQGLLLAGILFPFMSLERREPYIRAWSKTLLRICGMRLRMKVATPEGASSPAEIPNLAGVMLVANHVSWLDIYAINTWQPVRFVAKSEIRRWPVFGWLAVQTGTIFIEREKRSDARRIVHLLAESLAAGETVCVFPEGTTTDGTSLLPFHANLLQAPVSAKASILPIALRYEDAATGALSLAPAYAGATTLMECLNAILRAQPLQVSLMIGQPIDTQNLDRRQAALLGHQQILGLLQLPDTPPATTEASS